VPDVSKVKLFAGLPDKQVEAIGRGMTEVHQPAGKEVAVAGANGVGFMVILDGEAEVHLPHGRTRTLGPGDYYGEMALLDDQGRSATIVAKTDLTVAATARWDFKSFLEEHPEVAWRLLQTLSRRLREAEAAGAGA
jgi:CRP/FNR family transcriptional regulator, cyclic AMP receptor protein